MSTFPYNSNTAPHASSSSTSNNGILKYREYKIKSCIQSTNYHVMLMPEKSGGFLSFSEFVPPVRLYRNPKESLVLEHEANSSEPIEGIMSSNPKTKKKSQLITSFESPAQKALKAEEATPWILEDSDVKSFNSRLEGGQQQKYVLFVNQVRPIYYFSIGD